MKTIHVDGFVLSDQSDGTRTLSLMTKTGQIELVFTQELWRRLAETAQWFEDRHVQVPAVQPVEGAPDQSRDGAQDRGPPQDERPPGP